jgi:predicted metal-dependent phosphoesterase TrpH
MIKADLHIHTKYSKDSSTEFVAIIEKCQSIGINCIAIADHGTVEGALKLKAIAPFQVIVAEEVLTPCGEIMGMFLKEGIPTNISVEETIKRIKDQDGLICIPHPCDKVRPSAFNRKDLLEIISEVDIIEAFNARSYFNSQAKQIAVKYNKLCSAGSDAHSSLEIGNAYLEIPEFDDKYGFMTSLANGKIHGHKSSPLVHINSTFSKIIKRLNK